MLGFPRRRLSTSRIPSMPPPLLPVKQTHNIRHTRAVASYIMLQQHSMSHGWTSRAVFHLLDVVTLRTCAWVGARRLCVFSVDLKEGLATAHLHTKGRICTHDIVIVS